MSEVTPVLVDAAVLREKVHSKVSDALKSVFPLDLRGRTLEVTDVKVHAKDFSPEDQKKTLLAGGSLNVPVKGTLVLKDAKGAVIDQAKDFTLVHLPYLTDRHTVIADGNEYQFANQLRRKPGVYTQRADNGELRTVFNLGRGKNFDLGFNENKGTFHLQYGTSNIPLYAVLRGMGVPHDKISLHLGEGVARQNEREHGHQIETAVHKLYQKLEHPALLDAKLPHAGKVALIEKKFGQTTLDPDVTGHTLGKAHASVTPAALLDAASKMLAVHNGKVSVDDTDSLAFKTFHSMDDFLAERIRLTARQWAPKARMAFSTKSKIREALRPAPFTDSVRKFVTTSTLTAVPTGINPLELLDHAVKVTALGEGGIPSDRAIPLDARMTHSTHFGAIDPVRTPESNHAGVDVRASIAAHRDDRGNLYTAVHDVKNKKMALLKAGDLHKHVVAFPHQELKGQVKAFVNGEVQDVNASQVTHQLQHVSHQYSPATSLIPMIHNIQGNRAIMGSKMGTQALPLLEREVPFVQVKSHLPGDVSFETVYGHLTVPTAPVTGTVEKIKDGYIYIRPHKEKKAESDAQGWLAPYEVKVDFANPRRVVRPNISDLPHVGPYKEMPYGVNEAATIGGGLGAAAGAAIGTGVGLLLHRPGAGAAVGGLAGGLLGAGGSAYKQHQRNTAWERAATHAQDAGRGMLIEHGASRPAANELILASNLSPESKAHISAYANLANDLAAPWWKNRDTAEMLANSSVVSAEDTRRRLLSKRAEDRPVLEQKKLGPHTFNIEIKKSTGHKAEGQTKAKGSSEDYGHLPGYIGPDGDSLDFFVGDRHDGLIYAYDKQKRLNAKGELDPKAPWKATDTKFVVGHSPEEAEEFHRNTVKWNSPTIRFANRRFFKDWNHLQQHIDEHHKADKKTVQAGQQTAPLHPEIQTHFDKLAAEQGMPAATAWLQGMQDDAKARGYSIFAVVEDPNHPHGGGSITTVLPGHTGDAVRNARRAHVEWELANGHDPNHDWRTTDIKYMAGMSSKDKDAFIRRVNEYNAIGPTLRYALPKQFKDWNHLQQHIDEHHRPEKTAAAKPSLTAIFDKYHFHVDRPKGTVLHLPYQGQKVKITYPTHYGYLPGHVAEDNDALDFFIGGNASGVLGKATFSRPDIGAGVRETKFMVGLSPEERDHILTQFHPFSPEYTEIPDLDTLHRAIAQFKVEGTKTAADEKGLVKVPYEKNFPMPSKTYLNHTLEVKPGDKVEEGQRMGDSNFTRKGTLALGKNLLVAYMPYHGLNSNDAVVISESCSKKLTSEHMYREVYPLSSQIDLNRDKHKSYYGTKYTPQQYAKLDDTGVIKAGTRVDPKDPLIVGLTKTQIQGADLMLGRISKSLTKPFREVTLLWEHGTPGEVVEVHRSASQIALLIRTHEQMQVGDKLAGRYGNKGVVAKIVPDHEMIHDENKRPIDLILTSAGVVSRINPAQVIETAVGKVVEKTGKPILYNNAEQKDAVQWAKNLLKQHGVKDKEHVYDPIQKRTISGADGKGVLVGRQYIYKLFKSTDTNFSGHGVGPYDINEQPLKTGGDESAKGIGKMEFDALIAHNARNFLQEASTIKGQKNDEFWKAIQTGSPLPTPKSSFAFNKFTAMLEGSGIKVDKRGSKIKLLPMTDKDIAARSMGAIENKKTLIAKNLKPETGGLFDPIKTGGPQGTLYSHIDLHEPIPNPVFIEPVRRLLGLSQKDFESKLHDHGGGWFKDRLKEINVDAKMQQLQTQMKTATGPALDDIVKQLKYLRALKAEKMTPHEAYILNKVPVLPPVFRPILPDKRDPSQMMVADANKLYAHLLDTNDVLKNTALPSDLGKHRNMVFNAVGAVFGTHEVEDEKLKKQEVKGFLQTIAGVGTPKGGFFQRKLMRRTQDVSGRGTAVPDGNLGMDEVGIPEQMLWQMYDKMVVARLVRKGYSALDARDLVTKKAPAARDALLEESRDRPVLINRAPTLHRWSIVAAYPKLVPGKTIRVNPFIEKGMNLDYDGDTLQVHVPVQAGAISDAKQMTLSQMLLSDQQRNKLMAFPQHEAIIGFTLASKATANGPAKRFKTREDVLAAWRAGQLKLTDSIIVENEKRASLEEEVETPSSLTSDEALFYYPSEHVLGDEESTG